MLNSLKRFWKSDTLLFSNIDYKFLEDYKKYLDGHPRAQSLYLGCIRHIFNEAIREYNTDANTKISNNPFKSFKIPKDIPKTKDRVVNEVDLVRIFNFTSNPQPIGFSGILLAKRQNSFYCVMFKK